MTMILRAVAVSDRGLAREINEDAAHVSSRLVAIADGMGGGPAGEVASDITIRVLADVDAQPIRGDLISALGAAVDEANRRIRAAVDADPSLDGMGTTLTALLLSGRRIALVHVGDSRAYLWRGGSLVQLTRDDTYVQTLVERGTISSADARSHPHKSLVTQAVQGQPVCPAFTMTKARCGDRFLLCSDGLSDVVTDEAIGKIMRDYPDQRDCAEHLVQLALRAGGPDNITVIVADVSG